MMLRWLSRCKGNKVQCLNITQRFLSSSTSDDPPSKLLAEKGNVRSSSISDDPPSKPSTEKTTVRPYNHAINPFEEEETAEAQKVFEMLAAAKREADAKRTGYLKEEQDATSSYDKLRKMYIEQNMNKYDSDAVGKNLEDETPMERIIRVVKNDLTWKSFMTFLAPENISQYGTSDFLIVGSGISASLLGYYLKTELPKLEVTILEEDSLVSWFCSSTFIHSLFS